MSATVEVIGKWWKKDLKRVIDRHFAEARKYADEVIGRLPPEMGVKMRAKFEKKYRRARKRGDSESLYELNYFVTEIKEKIKQFSFKYATDDDALIREAEFRAASCERVYTRVLQDTGGDLDAAFLRLANICSVAGVDIPDPEVFGPYRACQRMIDSKWWRRRLRNKHWRGMEQLARQLNLVNVKHSIYATEDTVRRRAEQKASTSRRCRSQ